MWKLCGNYMEIFGHTWKSVEIWRHVVDTLEPLRISKEFLRILGNWPSKHDTQPTRSWRSPRSARAQGSRKKARVEDVLT